MKRAKQLGNRGRYVVVDGRKYNFSLKIAEPHFECWNMYVSPNATVETGGSQLWVHGTLTMEGAVMNSWDDDHSFTRIGTWKRRPKPPMPIQTPTPA